MRKAPKGGKLHPIDERINRIAAVETRLYRRRIDPTQAARPVFVTSLPRAGTTILLHMLAGCPELASATYRHMPFTLTPLLWGGFSSAFADRLAAAGFVVSVAVLAVVYGSVAAVRGWFPAPQIRLAHDTVVDLSLFWQNDLGIAPTRHLVPAPEPDLGRGYRRGDGAEPEPGYVLVAGVSDDQDTSAHVVRMLDRDGEEVHRWPIYYDRLDDIARPRNVIVHGPEVFEDGSLAVTFDVGNALARIDACGAPIWTVNGNFHHSITRHGEGAVVTWRDETIVRLDENTGEELSSLDIRQDVIPAADGEQRAYLEIRTVTLEEVWDRMVYFTDPFHPNDAEALRADMADAFPMFEAGDILCSLRELNLVAVADPEES